MPLVEDLERLPESIVPADVGRFRQHIDPAWIEEALAATGTATVRRRRLPADQVVWLVLGMALLRNESIERVVTMLDLALPAAGGKTAAKSAITQSRQRLGEEPLEYLFDTTADRWAHASAAAHQWRGLSLYGIDGSTLRMPAIIPWDHLREWLVDGDTDLLVPAPEDVLVATPASKRVNTAGNEGPACWQDDGERDDERLREALALFPRASA